MPSETVTIVIPTCERWELIRGTLAGALAQRDVDLEVVVVNDGRKPAPPDLLSGVESRVRIIEPAEHRGVGAARNAGIAVAEGSWIALLDDDDLWSPDKLASQLRSCVQHGASWSYAAGLYVDEQLVPFQYLPAPPADGLLDRLFRHQLIPGASSNLLVRTDLLRGMGAFDIELHQLADWDLCLRLAASAPAAPVQDVLLAYVQHGESMLITAADSVFLEYDRFSAKHADGAHRRGGRLDPESFSFWAVNRLEKAGHRRRALRASVYTGLHYREASLLRNAARLALNGVRSTPAPAQADVSQVPRPAWLASYSPAGAA